MAKIVDQYIDLLKKCLTAYLYEESSWKVIEPYSRGKKKSLVNILRFIVLRAIDKKRLMIVKRVPFDPILRECGIDWPCFGYTMIGLRRLDNIQSCIKNILKNKIPGDLIETGAWRGGSAIFMRAVLNIYSVTDRIVWVADSFEGMPEPKAVEYRDDAEYDISNIGYLNVSLEQVKANFARFRLLDEQVRFLKGWFCDTLPNAPIEKLSLLRLDGDLYESTMDSLKNLYYRVSPGGYVIVDDYNSWEPCKKAVTDFLDKQQITVDIIQIDDHAIYWQVPERMH